MKLINVSGKSAPTGHYSQAVSSNGSVYLSGILPIDQGTGEKLSAGSFKIQVSQVFKNLKDILDECGLTTSHLVKVNAYIKNAENWGAFNSLYAEFMGDHKPARTVIPVQELHYGFLIELDAIAEI
ncbi:MAG: RidA family protein [Saprospiraceae bacterium]|jgi:2-iminobutanoate/2-iminopropanoate deaminase|nr:RidA family protein [Saprospiraceae bacterium]